MNSDAKSLDILGIKPLSDAISTVTKGGVDGAGAFLSRICLPAAEEFGLLLRDKVKGWRQRNLENTLGETQRLIGPKPVYEAHPRVVHDILDKASWTDDEVIQKMWAGLLASSCVGDRSDGNLVLVNLLSQLTSVQVRILNYACEQAPKFKSMAGLPFADEILVDVETITKISGITDVHRLDRELDCLRILELIGSGGFVGHGGGFDPDTGKARLMPSAVALHLYVKAHGYAGTPVEFWQLEMRPPSNPPEASPAVNGTTA